MRLTHLTTYAAGAGLIVTSLVALPAVANATSSGTGSAFGISATGPVSISPVPEVSSSAKQPTRKSLATLHANPLVEASALAVSAWAGHGRASVADVKLAKAHLTASVITAKCENGNGVSHLARVNLHGRKLAVTPRPNSAIMVPVDGVGTVSVVLNKQVRQSDGSLTVTAIELSLPLGAGKTETVKISSVTCGRSPSGQPTSPGQTPPSDQSDAPSTGADAPGSPGTAPAPTPVPGDLAVTG